MHSGTWLVLDLDVVDVDVEALIDPDFFPKECFDGPLSLFHEDVYGPLIRPEDDFAARVTYESSTGATAGAFQDRTVAHAPERVADVDKKFDPKDTFRFMVTTKKEVAPEFLEDKMELIVVEIGNAAGSGV